jgi:Rieske 2Fe-2S family protein
MSPITPAPIDRAALARSLRPFGSSTMLPASAYVDQAIYEWEQKHAFGDSWVCLGRDDELLPPGGPTAQALTVGAVPLLLTRKEGVLRAFANTCPHRGHELLPEGCTAGSRAMVCPYHAWSFGLDGRLIGAPRMREVAGFDATAMGLTPIPLHVWQGWVLVNASGRAAPVADHVGALDGLTRPYRMAELRLGGRRSYTIAANWKVIVENYHECYHCPLIHPELCQVTPPDSGDNYDLPGAWVGGSMDLRDGAETMSLDGRSLGLPIEGAEPGKVGYFGLFPNLLLSAHPDYVMAHRITPRSADSTQVECSWFFPPAAFERPGFDPAYATGFWDLTNAEDWTACESVQRGLGSPHFRPGPLAPGEDAVHQWISMVGNVYGGISPHVS